MRGVVVVFGILGDDAGVNVVSDRIGGRDIACLCCKRGDGARGTYMLAKTCKICLSAACCALPTM